MAFEEPAGDEQRTGKFADGVVEAQRTTRAFVAPHAAAPQIPRERQGTIGTTVGALTTRRAPRDP